MRLQDTEVIMTQIFCLVDMLILFSYGGSYRLLPHVIPVRRRIAMVSGGEQSGYGLLTVREQLWMFAQFYGVPSRVAHQRFDELLEAVDLDDHANQKIYALSTGMRQRINLCRALVSDHEILFLDEPTVGLH